MNDPVRRVVIRIQNTAPTPAVDRVVGTETVELEAATAPANTPHVDELAPGYCCVRCWKVAAAQHTQVYMFRPFIVCPDCGNKRCPRASQHQLTCTGSNDPGQRGSYY